MSVPCLLRVLLLEVVSVAVTQGANNLTCYQCIRYANEQCGNESLRACPPVSDRCVTHISNDDQKGYVIKRECGLGPCGFEDDMVNRGLGLDGCDRSKDEYFCVSCCKTNGCNKNDAATVSLHWPTSSSIAAAALFLGPMLRLQQP